MMYIGHSIPSTFLTFEHFKVCDSASLLIADLCHTIYLIYYVAMNVPYRLTGKEN